MMNLESSRPFRKLGKRFEAFRRRLTGSKPVWHPRQVVSLVVTPKESLMKLNRFRRMLTSSMACMGLVAAAHSAFANTIPFSLSSGNLSQDWTNTGLITANDDWSGVPSITGHLGDDNAASPTAVDPTTIVAAGTGTIDVIANQAAPNTLTSGGVAEFEIANPTVALQGSGTADNPYLLVYVESLGRTGVTIRYNVRDIDGSADNAIQQVALQYRLGNSGDFVNVPGTYIADATTGPNLAELVTPVTASLPAWSNAALVQFRIMTTNAAGSDEWVGIDDISVTSTAVPEPATLALGSMALIGVMAARRRS
jgi:hypothetical protein